MPETTPKQRIDSASRVIAAPARAIYQAFLDPNALVQWLPPEGTTAHIDEFDPREGGSYRMTLTYTGDDRPGRGKTSDNTDLVEGRFLELTPHERIIQAIEFKSDDPAFAGEIRMTWSISPIPGGTRVTITCENVPEGIRKEDHDTGLRSSLANLAAFVEGS